MGAYHTLDLELNRKFTLFKENWDTIALERIGKFLFYYLFNSDYYATFFIENCKNECVTYF